jgi:hypothetical protein
MITTNIPTYSRGYVKKKKKNPRGSKVDIYGYNWKNQNMHHSKSKCLARVDSLLSNLPCSKIWAIDLQLKN